jgi:ribonuclease HI
MEGVRAGVILVSPQGDKMNYILRMTFPNESNNEAEYESLVHGMKMAKACDATRLKIFGRLSVGSTTCDEQLRRSQRQHDSI